MPPIRVLGGNQQEAAFEGALPVYEGRGDMLIFSDNCYNIHYFIVLGLMEMIAQLRVASILYLAVVTPMRWLAGNTHKLSEYG